MTPDRSDALVVTERRAGDGGRRTVYEPRSDGRVDRIEETLTKRGDWREVGHEIITAVDVEGATDGAAVLTRGP